MDKVITTALLIIAGVVCSVFLFNSVYPMLNRSSSAMLSMTEKIDDRMKSRIDIIHAASSPDRRTVTIWVKNTGSARILAVEESDVFCGLETNFTRVPYSGDAGGSYPRWQYQIENGTEWQVGGTVKITVTFDTDPGTGTYMVKIVIPNGILTEYLFSV